MAVTKSTDPIDILLEMGIDLDNLSEEEDYLSALKEAIAKIQFQTKGAGDERQRILQEEVIKVRNQGKQQTPSLKQRRQLLVQMLSLIRRNQSSNHNQFQDRKHFLEKVCCDCKKTNN